MLWRERVNGGARVQRRKGDRETKTEQIYAHGSRDEKRKRQYEREGGEKRAR
jgi:hypothetical protein